MMIKPMMVSKYWDPGARSLGLEGLGFRALGFRILGVLGFRGYRAVEFTARAGLGGKKSTPKTQTLKLG